MMTTASDIITLALKDCQILDETETPSAALMADSLTTLNQMLSLWQTERNYIYAQTEVTHTPTGALSYTVGTGGDFNIAAPQSIDYAYLRVGLIDYPITLLNSFEEYQAIEYKTIQTIPEYAYYNPTHPLGTIYFYPQPNTGVLHLGISVQLPNYALAADDIALPENYLMPIRFSLAEYLAAMIGKDVPESIAKFAKNARNIMKRSNVRIKPLETVDNGRFNILSGR
ncbi:MAG: hypothetical protein WC756_21230 [Taibaiella sp.]|jgi:hypothetical protein